MKSSTAGFVVIGALLYVVVRIGVIVGIVWTIIHFVRKLW